jgi:hypothetical protein
MFWRKSTGMEFPAITHIPRLNKQKIANTLVVVYVQSQSNKYSLISDLLIRK